MAGLEPAASWSTARRPAEGNPTNRSISDAPAGRGCRCGCFSVAEDADLAAVRTAWPNLPAAVRKVILNLVEAAGEGGGR